MASILARITGLFGRPADEPRLLRDLAPAERSERSSMFRPFARRDAGTSGADGQAVMTDLLVSLREAIDRQALRHDETMGYLSGLPKAFEGMPEQMKLQSEALAAIRAHQENQIIQARQLSAILDKVGQTTTDHRRLLESVRQQQELLAEHHQKVAEHFSSFASALTTSSDTTKIAGEVLRALETNIRQRDEALERIIRVHQGRHTVLLAAAVVLAGAALVAATVGVYLVQQGR